MNPIVLPAVTQPVPPFCYLGAGGASTQKPEAMQLADSVPSRSRANHSSGSSRRGRDDSKKGPWRCSNCPKEFAQKEYRYKHQQRCIQASNRQKLSKQKSCVACASSKLGCDQSTPSCSRCINRNKRCVYISSTNEVSGPSNRDASQPQRQQDRQSDSQQKDTQDPLFYFNGESQSSHSENAPPRETSTSSSCRLEDNMRAPLDPNHGTDATHPMQVSASSSMHPPLQQQHEQHLATTSPDGALVPWSMDTDGARHIISEQMLDGTFGNVGMTQDLFQQRMDIFGSESRDSISRWQRNGSWVANSPFMSPGGQPPADMDDSLGGNAMAGMANDDLNFDLLGSLGILTENGITPGRMSNKPSFSPILTGAASSVSGVRMSPMNTTNNTQGQTPSSSAETESSSKGTLHEAVKSITSDSPPSPTSRRKFDVNQRLDACPFHKLNTDDDLVRIIRGYPSVMVRPGVYPPFVHHKLYRCSAGDIAEPLARAFCCIGAFYASVPTSEMFVHSLINEESRKLVKGFHQWPGSDSDMLAVVHAMCVYQILGFFVSTSSDQARSAELQHLFFIKMARQLIRQCLQSTTSQSGEETNWRKWVMDETIRRTVFLINAINTLSCRIQKQDPYYFEPLNDTLIRSMALPAPEALWKASSAEEWNAAKAQIGPEGMGRSQMSVQQVVDKFREAGEQSNLGSCQSQYESFDEFTRLVLATIEN